jgi:hypothetical protein
MTYTPGILKNPAGTFCLVGTLPVSLCHEAPGGFLRANVYPTEAQAIAALVGAGIERFQLADCSFYGEEGA